MKKYAFLLWSLLPILVTSCAMDNNGSPHFTTFGWLLLFSVVIIFLILMIRVSKEREVSEVKMKEKGMDYSQFVPLGTYGGGHPDIDKTIEGIYCRKEEENLALYHIPIMTVSMPDKITAIPIESITDITIEDASSIEKKITVGRIFLVGIFALGWKKKKKNELAFLIIEWKRGKFEHSTIFSFEGKDAFQNANTSRNKLISFCEEVTKE